MAARLTAWLPYSKKIQKLAFPTVSCCQAIALKTPDCLCDFPVHQTLKFNLYFPHSVRPPFVIKDFTFSVVLLREIRAVLKPDLIRFGPKTSYGA